MNRNLTDPTDGVSRREALAAGATGLSLSLSGCIDTVRSVVTGVGNDQLSLSIVTVPGDNDRETVRIASRLEEHLLEVGIDASHIMRSPSEFLEKVLIEQDFDLYVGPHPADFDPDFLYESLHSTYANEAGWQNPFGFDSMAFDALLEGQRRADGAEREAQIASVLRGLAEEKPFEPLCRPDEIRVAGTERFDGWGDGHLATRLGYLGVEPEPGVDRMNALLADARPTTNVNPLSATIRERGTIVDLLYDSLGTVVDGTVRPWLAESWEWDDTEDVAAVDADAEGTETATVHLREDCRFHDGRPVTARDVAFTYRFLEDTALGQAEFASPAPRYRGHASAVEEVEIEDDHTLRITVDAGTEVGERAFTAPILPRHVWRGELEERIGNRDDFTAPQGRWGLVTTDSISPVGSGPFQFADQEDRTYLTLERFDDHFTRREGVDLPAPRVEELRFTIDPGSTMVTQVESGDADVTSARLSASSVGNIPDDPAVERLEDPSWTFYHIGFNTRVPPCSNLHFRRAVCRLLDKQWLADEVFHGHAEPITTPVTDEWAPDDLAWDGEDSVTPFAGSDGTLNVEAARAAFEAAGYHADDDGRLLRRY